MEQDFCYYTNDWKKAHLNGQKPKDNSVIEISE